MSAKVQMNLDQLVRTDHVTPITRTKQEAKREEDQTNAMASRQSTERASVPVGYLLTIIGLMITLLLSAIGGIAQHMYWKGQMDSWKATYDRDNERHEREIDKLNTYMQNSREWIKEHGFEIADDGKIMKRRK